MEFALALEEPVVWVFVLDADDVDVDVSKAPPVKSEKLKSGMLRSPVLVSTGKYLSHSF